MAHTLFSVRELFQKDQRGPADDLHLLKGVKQLSNMTGRCRQTRRTRPSSEVQLLRRQVAMLKREVRTANTGAFFKQATCIHLRLNEHSLMLPFEVGKSLEIRTLSNLFTNSKVMSLKIKFQDYCLSKRRISFRRLIRLMQIRFPFSLKACPH